MFTLRNGEISFIPKFPIHCARQIFSSFVAGGGRNCFLPPQPPTQDENMFFPSPPSDISLYHFPLAFSVSEGRERERERCNFDFLESTGESSLGKQTIVTLRARERERGEAFEAFLMAEARRKIFSSSSRFKLLLKGHIQHSKKRSHT